MLLVEISDTLYPITDLVLHQVFDVYGNIEMIYKLPLKETFQVLLRFENPLSAKCAKSGLHGRDIYDGCCRLDIQFISNDFLDKADSYCEMCDDPLDSLELRSMFISLVIGSFCARNDEAKSFFSRQNYKVPSVGNESELLAKEKDIVVDAKKVFDEMQVMGSIKNPHSTEYYMKSEAVGITSAENMATQGAFQEEVRNDTSRESVKKLLKINKEGIGNGAIALEKMLRNRKTGVLTQIKWKYKLLDRGKFVGAIKMLELSTHLFDLDDMAFRIGGKSRQLGSPTNPAATELPRVSSGIFVAVGPKLDDFSLDIYTEGGARLPAGYCGIFGFRPSIGTVSFSRVIPVSRSLNNVGWFAKVFQVSVKLNM